MYCSISAVGMDGILSRVMIISVLLIFSYTEGLLSSGKFRNYNTSELEFTIKN